MASTSFNVSAEDSILTPFEDTAPSPAMVTPPFQEQPVKLRGRQRLLAGLQRISSSPSIARLNSSRSRGYNGSGKGSISCISLNSASSYAGPPFGTPFTHDSSSSSSAAPLTSADVSTPGLQTPTTDERARVRYVSAQDGKSSVGVPLELRPAAKTAPTFGIAEVNEDYFSHSRTRAKSAPPPPAPQKDFNFWRDLPAELKMEVLTYLAPREIARCSAVSKSWHDMCFDGQLWSKLDTAGFYQQISADALVSIITKAGPFMRDLNLRGCVQLRERWNSRGLSDACTNLENLSIEGCRIDRASIHNFLYANSRLVHINLSGLAGATNAGMRIIAANCPKLECLNVSWCNNVDTRGLKRVVESCPNLKDLRAGETRGWDDEDFMHDVFVRNTLERLVLMNCDTLTDESLTVLIEGRDGEIDFLTGRPVVLPRKFKHLDLTRCRRITDQGVRTLVGNIPEIEGLQLSKCHGVLDATLVELLPTTPMLSHFDIEEMEDLSNAVMLALANAPCAKRMHHLSISYCENISDTGMLPVLKACTNLRSLEMDNTRIGDLVLAEAAAMVRERTPRVTVQGPMIPGKPLFQPGVGLRLVAYDCQNVTWTGVREVLSRNADISIITHTTQLPPLEKSSPSPSSSSSSAHSSAASSAEVLASHPPAPRIHIVRSSTFPSEIIQLKCFYTYQPTVEEHTKRVLRGDFLAARRLERKWAEFMMAQEEAGAAGAGSRRRRRRAREAQMMHADEEDIHTTGLGVGGGRRRRARSGGCSVM